MREGPDPAGRHFCGSDTRLFARVYAMCGTEVALLVVLAVVLASWWHSTHAPHAEGLRGGRGGGGGRGHGGRAHSSGGRGGGWGGGWRGGGRGGGWRPAWWNRTFNGRPWSYWWGVDPAAANSWVAGWPGFSDWCAWCDTADPGGMTEFCAANCSYGPYGL